jgi:hypothetical protein
MLTRIVPLSKIREAIEGRLSFNVKWCHTQTGRYVRYGTLLTHPHFSNNFDEICGPPPHRRIFIAAGCESPRCLTPMRISGPDMVEPRHRRDRGKAGLA